MSTQELKPCPFCGKTGTRHPVDTDHVCCNDDSHSFICMREDVWNRRSPATQEEQPVAWMRVIHASNGQPVLFYIENDPVHDDCSMVHCYARFDGFDADMKLQGIPTEKIADVFAALSTKSADAIVNQANKFIGDDDE